MAIIKPQKKKVDDFPSFRYDPPAFEWRTQDGLDI